MPDFGALQAIRSGVVGNFLLSVKGLVNKYGVRYDGQLQIDTPGTYEFYVVSNDGSRLDIDGVTVVDNDGLHGAIEKQGELTLQAGLHPIRLDYFQKAGSEALQVFWSGPNFSKQLLPDSQLFHTPQ